MADEQGGDGFALGAAEPIELGPGTAFKGGEKVKLKPEDVVRQRLAMRLSIVFGIAVFVGPLLYVAITVLSVTGKLSEPAALALTDALPELATGLIAAVSGVFGAVVGFYFGSSASEGPG